MAKEVALAVLKEADDQEPEGKPSKNLQQVLRSGLAKQSLLFRHQVHSLGLKLYICNGRNCLRKRGCSKSP